MCLRQALSAKAACAALSQRDLFEHSAFSRRKQPYPQQRDRTLDRAAGSSSRSIDADCVMLFRQRVIRHPDQEAVFLQKFAPRLVQQRRIRLDRLGHMDAAVPL